MSDRIQASVPVQAEGLELAARNPEFREHVVGLAEYAMNAKALERGRKISERPTLTGMSESPLTASIVYFEFEAETQPI